MALRSPLPGLKQLSSLSEQFQSHRHAQRFKSLRDYFQVQAVAGYIGWLGHGNFGDEVIYTAFQRLFPQLQILRYRGQSQDLPLELALYQRLVKSRPLYDLMFLGGGTLINRQLFLDWLHQAQAQGYRTVVFGTGVCDPSFWTQQRPDMDFPQLTAAWTRALNQVAYLSVRGPQSARILAAQGVAAPEVIGDPALSVCLPRSPRPICHRRLAINLGSHGFIWGNQTRINQAIAQLAQTFLQRGWQVEFLVMHPSDRALGETLREQFGLESLSFWTATQPPRKTIQRLHTYDLLVGQRLHAVVLACGCGIPAISLAYQPKCLDFMESMGQLPLAVRTDVLTSEQLLELSQELLQHYRDYAHQLLQRSRLYRERQQQAAQELRTWLEGSTAG